MPTAAFVTQRDWSYPVRSSEAAVQAAVRADGATFVDAGALALRLLGDTIYSNPFMLGFAWQKGLVPLSRPALQSAIELNGVAVPQNLRAFAWGRYAAHDPEGLRARLATSPSAAAPAEPTIEALVRQRADHLAAYAGEDYARRYRALVQRVEAAEAALGSGRALSRAVATYYARLLAYKDEYEVARLHANPAFEQRLAEIFEGDYTIEYHLAPPLFSKRNARGELVKRPFGGWMKGAFRILARLRFLRGTALDPFGYTAERRAERALIARYETIVDEILASLGAHNHAVAVEMARVPDQVRGFGHVKAPGIAKAQARWDELTALFRRDDADAALAEEQANRVQVKAFRMF